MSEVRPDYYKGKDGKDLFDRFEEGLLSADQVRGFYQGNIIKYVIRYRSKNGTEDLEKAKTYLNRLKGFETNLQSNTSGDAPMAIYGNGKKFVVNNNDDAK